MRATLFAALLCAACVHVSARPAPAYPLPAAVVPVPLVFQQTDFSCGPAAVLAVLRYFDAADYGGVGEADLYDALGTSPNDGTDPLLVPAFFDEHTGLEAELRTAVSDDELEAALARGEPVLVNLQAWRERRRSWANDWDDGHFVVLVGTDAQNWYFMDPGTEGHYAYIPRAQLDERWHDALGDGRAHRTAIFVHARSPAQISLAAPAVATFID